MRKKNFPLVIGIGGCSFFIFLAMVGPYLPGIDPKLTTRSYYPDFFSYPPFPPSEDFLLGTDREGRDVLSYLVIGTRHTLATVLGISLSVFILGMVLAVSAAHSKSINLVLQAGNYLFSRVPVIFMVMFFSLLPIFVFSAHRILWMIGLIILFEVGKIAEVMKKSILQVQASTYYEAATVLGTGIKGLFTRYYWPLCSPQWLSYFFTHLGSMLFLIGQLGVFGIFLSQSLSQMENGAYMITNTAVEWPLYISNVLVDIDGAPWIPISAAVFIGIAMFSFFALSEGIRRQSRLEHQGWTERRGMLRLFSFKRFNQTKVKKSA